MNLAVTYTYHMIFVILTAAASVCQIRSNYTHTQEKYPNNTDLNGHMLFIENGVLTVLEENGIPLHSVVSTDGY